MRRLPQCSASRSSGSSLPVAPGGPHRLGSGAVQHGLAGSDRGEHGLRYGVRVVHGGEFGQPHPVPGRVPHGLGGLLRQPCLPGPAGPEQRDEPGRREVTPDGIDVGLPADEGGEAGAEVAGQAGHRERGGRGDGRPTGCGPAGCRRRSNSPCSAPQFGTRVGAQPVRQQPPYVLVRGQCLRRAARVAQGAQAQGPGGVRRGGGCRTGRSVRAGTARRGRGRARRCGGRAGRPGGGSPSGPPRPCGRGGRRGRDRATGPRASSRTTAAFAGSPSASARVPSPVSRSKRCRSMSSGAGREPVAALRRGHRVRAERPAQPAHQRLQRARRVGGRVAAPHLVDQDAAGTVRPARSASTVSRARSRAPPTGTGVPSGRSAWVVPRMR